MVYLGILGEFWGIRGVFLGVCQMLLQYQECQQYQQFHHWKKLLKGMIKDYQNYLFHQFHLLSSFVPLLLHSSAPLFFPLLSSSLFTNSKKSKIKKGFWRFKKNHKFQRFQLRFGRVYYISDVLVFIAKCHFFIDQLQICNWSTWYPSV